jgi:hypothetical protein
MALVIPKEMLFYYRTSGGWEKTRKFKHLFIPFITHHIFSIISKDSFKASEVVRIPKLKTIPAKDKLKDSYLL